MIAVSFLKLHVFQAVFAHPELRLLSIILWEGREVPCINLVIADVNLVHVFHFCDLRKKKKTTLKILCRLSGGEAALPHIQKSLDYKTHRFMFFLQCSRGGIHFCISL